MQAGTRNLITDVEGLTVGNATDQDLKSGTTVLVCDTMMTASGSVMGGAPGSVETALLEPDKLVKGIDAITLTGGSAFGLDAAGGVKDALAREGRGIHFGGANVPIVPGANIFDLMNGGDKSTIPGLGGATSPFRGFGEEAYASRTKDFEIGSVGAGTGATTANLKGGLGSASTVLENGITVGALVVVNAVGSATFGNSPHFRAAGFEIAGEYGERGFPRAPVPLSEQILTKLGSLEAGQNTTLAIIATDAALSKSDAHRIAITAHDGIATALYPAHTPFDGDIVFALSTGKYQLDDPNVGRLTLGTVATATLARAIARGVYAASASNADRLPTWQDKFNASEL